MIQQAGGGGANYGWGFSPAIRLWGQGGVHFRQRQGGEVFSRIGGGTLHERATL